MWPCTLSVRRTWTPVSRCLTPTLEPTMTSSCWGPTSLQWRQTATMWSVSTSATGGSVSRKPWSLQTTLIRWDAAATLSLQWIKCYGGDRRWKKFSLWKWERLLFIYILSIWVRNSSAKQSKKYMNQKQLDILAAILSFSATDTILVSTGRNKIFQTRCN